MAKEKFRDLAKRRVNFAILVYMLMVLVLISRLAYFQIINPEKFTDKAVRQQRKDEKIVPQRGTIMDRNGKVLALSVRTYDITIEKKYVSEYMEENIAMLNKVLGTTEEEFMEKYNASDVRFIIAKKVSQEKIDELTKLVKDGKNSKYWIGYTENSQRMYPYGQFASQIVGYVSKDNHGLAGIEQSMDRELRGVYGRRIVTKDNVGRELPNSEIRFDEAIDGYQIVLTIDEVIQRYVEKITYQTLVDTNAVGVTSIVFNPKTGEILAMSSKPDGDPNNPRVPTHPEQVKQFEKAETLEEKSAIINKIWRNPSVQDVYEPGSTFKLITAATAIEESLVNSNDVFYDSGHIKVNDRTIGNWTSVPYGAVDFRKATVESINTVFVQVGQKIGGERFLRYVKSFGFGEKTGIELPNEAEGIIYSKENLRPVELATMSFGQGVSITPIQLVTAVSAMANDGKLIKPTIIKEIRTKDGEIIDRHEIEYVRSPISADTASKVLDIMESVGDAASRAQIEGYRIAGKSGTAQKVVDGKKGYTALIGSFIGIVPIEDPELIVLTIVDQPRSGPSYGGVVAAPVVKNIMEYSLRYLGINPETAEDYEKNKVTIPEIRNMTVEQATKILDSKNLKYRSATTSIPVESSDIIVDCFPAPSEKIAQGSEIVLYLKNKSGEIEIPDLTGKTIDEANSILGGLGLKPTFNGVGVVKGQSPKAGTKVEEGSIVSLDLAE